MSSNTSKSSRGRLTSAMKKVGRSKPDPTPQQSHAFVLDLTLLDSIATYSATQSPVDSVGSSSLSRDQHSLSQELESDMLDMENMAWGPPPSNLNLGWKPSIFARRNPQSKGKKDRPTT